MSSVPSGAAGVVSAEYSSGFISDSVSSPPRTDGSEWDMAFHIYHLEMCHSYSNPFNPGGASPLSYMQVKGRGQGQERVVLNSKFSGIRVNIVIPHHWCVPIDGPLLELHHREKPDSMKNIAASENLSSVRRERKRCRPIFLGLERTLLGPRNRLLKTAFSCVVYCSESNFLSLTPESSVDKQLG